ncbi:uncharacterized protein [Dermacentor andersoni]|uniref:uncharacterized protein isoform X4 n=1 Tax=Dermacentor andersoni TaxID=34620 RepID=UPI002416B22B|nr:uncharacterized protein LOC126543989 isoform X4 [Dermacentor andersoni]
MSVPDTADSERQLAANELRRMGLRVPCLKSTPSTGKQATSNGWPLFGLDILEQPQQSSHLVAGLTVPWFLDESLRVLLSHASTEGILRKSGSLARQRLLRSSLETSASLRIASVVLASAPVHDVSGLLKQWLQLLPEPLLPKPLVHLLLRCQVKHGLEAVLLGLRLLPEERLACLRHLLSGLSQLAADPQSRMGPHNLAVVLAPTLCGPPTIQSANREDLDRLVSLVEALIEASHLVGCNPAPLPGREGRKKTSSGRSARKGWCPAGNSKPPRTSCSTNCARKWLCCRWRTKPVPSLKIPRYPPVQILRKQLSQASKRALSTSPRSQSQSPQPSQRCHRPCTSFAAPAPRRRPRASCGVVGPTPFGRGSRCGTALAPGSTPARAADQSAQSARKTWRAACISLRKGSPSSTHLQWHTLRLSRPTGKRSLHSWCPQAHLVQSTTLSFIERAASKCRTVIWRQLLKHRSRLPQKSRSKIATLCPQRSSRTMRSRTWMWTMIQTRTGQTMRERQVSRAPSRLLQLLPSSTRPHLPRCTKGTSRLCHLHLPRLCPLAQTASPLHCRQFLLSRLPQTSGRVSSRSASVTQAWCGAVWKCSTGPLLQSTRAVR